MAYITYNGELMTDKTSRLDIPGFSYGQKTNEFIDVPRILGGRGTNKRSPKPHSAQELMAGQNISRKRKLALTIAKLAQKEFSKGKRKRARELYRALTGEPVRPCIRRYLEFSGLRHHNAAFTSPIEIVQSKPKMIYEVTDGLLPYVSFTSSREALLLIASAARYGVALYFNQIDLRRR